MVAQDTNLFCLCIPACDGYGVVQKAMASEKKAAPAGGHHNLSFAENLVAGGLAGVGTFMRVMMLHRFRR